ncbi:hypothetical protein CDQ92_06710 [Sphingopyxis bauzanensis]|jgi:uncharacterized OB-fold protein|uniref:DUF35 domain-containing protein n=1 Tax=Sphingopyxis bauzanensis TaxID=651663 RepID=A0A246JUR0_9SPHN|nr:OB-fold domain-containing protein [Sphingopyxis bauzanensis]OWQ96811.1 hypothetical protein CDQ92_06710 [Sphingopyxis bauzanensis]GGJ57666.1 hypothetical protein GCM10011393_29880 [Sphingopyxis bauzanensis]
MTDTPLPSPLPAASYIQLDGPEPRLSFLKCRSCGTMFLEPERLACARCGSRDGFDAHEPRYEGTLHSYSIVHRSFPGTAVPFISAVVDIDDGPSLKGNLRGVPFDADQIDGAMRVRIVFDDALGRRDADGNAYISHFFEPLAAD